MDAALAFLQKMLPYLGAALPFALLWRVCAARRLHRAGVRDTPLHELGCVLFALFLAGLFGLTVLCEARFPLPAPSLDRVNLTPFRFIADSRAAGGSYFLINFWGNILMFLPLGFCPPLLWRASRRGALLCGFCCSLAVEISQLFLARGTDLDDLLLNTLGALLGWVAYRAFDRLFPRFCARFRAGKAGA